MEGQKVLKFLNRTDILSVRDLSMEPCPTPEWGEGTGVMVRVMPQIEKERFIKSIRKIRQGPDPDNPGKTIEKFYVELEGSGAALVAATACDTEGNLLFQEKDIQALNQKSSAPIKRITDMAERLNGLNDEAREAAKNVSASPDPEIVGASNTGSQPISEGREKSSSPASTPTSSSTGKS